LRWDFSFRITQAELEAEIIKRQNDGLYPHSIGSFAETNESGQSEPRFVVMWMDRELRQ
jgi:hypothetical protein